MTFEDFVKRSIAADKRRLKRYRGIAGRYAGKKLLCRFRRATGKTEYYYREPETGKEHYLGLKDCRMIVALQKKEVLTALIEIIRHNIECKERLCRELLSEDIELIMAKLPRACQPNETINNAYDKATKNERARRIHQSESNYKREELTVITSFGLYVRTKGELAIAELLYDLGIEFFYEKALQLHVRRQDDNGNYYWMHVTRYPDFTIKLGDGSYLFWEHKGLLSKWNYTERDIQKEIDYNMNGIFQGHNLIVTAEDAKNGIDMETIRNMVEGWIMPMVV